jgi:hypothetical protein
MIKPIRIEPKDIHVTFEIPVRTIQSLSDFFEGLPVTLVEKFFPGREDVESSFTEAKTVFKEILDHPLVKKGE